MQSSQLKEKSVQLRAAAATLIEKADLIDTQVKVLTKIEEAVGEADATAEDAIRELGDIGMLVLGRKPQRGRIAGSTNGDSARSHIEKIFEESSEWLTKHDVAMKLNDLGYKCSVSNNPQKFLSSVYQNLYNLVNEGILTRKDADGKTTYIRTKKK